MHTSITSEPTFSSRMRPMCSFLDGQCPGRASVPPFSEVSRSCQVFDDGAQAAHQAISGATTSGSVVSGVALEPNIFQFNVLVVGRATYFVEGGGEDSLLTLRPGTPSRCAAGVHVGPILGAASWALTWTGFNRSGSQSSLNMSSDALVTMARRIRP